MQAARFARSFRPTSSHDSLRLTLIDYLLFTHASSRFQTPPSYFSSSCSCPSSFSKVSSFASFPHFSPYIWSAAIAYLSFISFLLLHVFSLTGSRLDISLSPQQPFLPFASRVSLCYSMVHSFVRPHSCLPSFIFWCGVSGCGSSVLAV